VRKKLVALAAALLTAAALSGMGALVAQAVSAPTAVKAFEWPTQSNGNPQAAYDRMYASGYRLAIVPLDVRQTGYSSGAPDCAGWAAAKDELLKATNAGLMVAGDVFHPGCAAPALENLGVWQTRLQFVALNQPANLSVTTAQVAELKSLGHTPAVFGDPGTWTKYQGTTDFFGAGAGLIEWDNSAGFDPLTTPPDFTSPAAHGFGGYATSPQAANYRIGVMQKSFGAQGAYTNTFSLDSRFLRGTPPSPTPTSAPTPAPTAAPVPSASPTAVPTPAPTAPGDPVVAVPPAQSSYPLHTSIVSTTFWVGEIFNATVSDGSQVCSTYDSQWAAHHTGVQPYLTPSSASACPGSYYGGCDGVASGATSATMQCATEARDSTNGFFPKTQPAPLENPFYLDLPYDDVNDATAFKERCSVIPWAAADNAASKVNHCTDAGYSYMKNRWVAITGPNDRTCYGQIEDAGPSSGILYHDKAYVFGQNNARPVNKKFSGDPAQGAGMDVSPALNGCLGFADLDGDNDHVAWRFVAAADVPPGPWTRVVTHSGVSE
jgi:hypothetical protein